MAFQQTLQIQPFVFQLVHCGYCEDILMCGVVIKELCISLQHSMSSCLLSSIYSLWKVLAVKFYSSSPFGSETCSFILWLKRSQGAAFGMSERACVCLCDSPDGNAWLCFCSLALSLVFACVLSYLSVLNSSGNMIINVCSVLGSCCFLWVLDTHRVVVQPEKLEITIFFLFCFSC